MSYYAGKYGSSTGNRRSEATEIEQRQAIANEWLEAAEEVALNSGLDLALEVADFLKTRIGLGIANRPGYLMIFYHLRPELKVSDFAFITPVLAIDNHYVANLSD